MDSQIEELFFVINSVVKLVEVSDEVLLSEWIVWLLIRAIA